MNGMIARERAPARREALEPVVLAAALCEFIIFSHGVTLLTKLNMESIIFAGVGSEHFSNSATTQVWRFVISLSDQDFSLIHGNFYKWAFSKNERNAKFRKILRWLTFYLHSLAPKASDGKLSSPIKLLDGSVFGT